MKEFVTNKSILRGIRQSSLLMKHMTVVNDAEKLVYSLDYFWLKRLFQPAS